MIIYDHLWSFVIIYDHLWSFMIIDVYFQMVRVLDWDDPYSC